MEFLQVAAAVLSLLSVGRSAPVSSCESLIRPIEINGREQLLGEWTYIAESVNIPAAKLLTEKFVETGRMKITAAANKSDAVDIFQSQKMFGCCFTVTTTVTLENNTISGVRPFNSSTVLLSTGCPDCLVLYSNYTIGGHRYSGLQLLSRRNKVTAAELEEFRKQVECQHLYTPAILDPEKGFCSLESPSQETEDTDLTNMMDVLKLVHKIPDNESVMQFLLEILGSRLKGNEHDQ